MQRQIFTFSALFMLVTVCANSLLAQVPIHYSFFISSVEGNSTSRYREGMSSLQNTFDDNTLSSYRKLFGDKLKQNKSVVNFIDPTGMRIPTAFPNESLEGSMEIVKLGELMPLGNMFISTSALKTMSLKGDQLMGEDYYFRDVSKGIGSEPQGEDNTRSLDKCLAACSGASFTETWEYKDGIFSKNVVLMGLMRNFIRNGSFLGAYAFMNFESDKAFSDPGTKPLAANVVYDVYFNSGESSEDRLKELTTQGDVNAYMYPADRFILIQGMMKDVSSGKLKVYTYDAANMAEFGAEASVEQFLEGFNTFTRSVTKDRSTGEDQEIVTVEPKMVKDIIGIRFIEDWSVPNSGFGLIKNVKGLVLLSRVKDEKGNTIGSEPTTGYVIKFGK